MKHTTRQAKNKTESGFSEKSQAYLHIHAHALFSSLGRIIRNAFTSLMTIIVMAIAISLASGFYLFVVNMQQLTGNIESTNQISLFLKSHISDNSGKKLADKIKKNPKVGEVTLITKDQALREFKAYSGFGDALDVLENNPLPTVIQVLPNNTLDNIQAVESLMMEFDRLPQVDFAQLDMQWIQRLQSMMQIMQRAVFVLTLLLGFAVIVITGNTIRLELQNRQDEVVVAKLVGATHSFIQRPFLYTGFWLGLFSGLLAWLLVTVILLVLQGPIENLSILYDGSFDLSYFSFVDIISLLSLSSFLSVIGAWIVLHYQLQTIKPR
ncbi:MAG: FtsX-like permease family protein [Methylococcaceae bacterium]|nr:FtsX-like permease family protein [Methylococcaceae bacterium]